MDFEYFKHLVYHYYQQSELDPKKAKLIVEKVSLRMDTLSREVKETYKEKMKCREPGYDLVI